jgi:hypothetical protein
MKVLRKLTLKMLPTTGQLLFKLKVLAEKTSVSDGRSFQNVLVLSAISCAAFSFEHVKQLVWLWKPDVTSRTTFSCRLCSTIKLATIIYSCTLQKRLDPSQASGADAFVWRMKFRTVVVCR